VSAVRAEILLATYNGEKYLREQLDSILSQDDDRWHLTVSDDGARRVLAVVNKSPDKAVALDVSAFGVKAASLSATVLSGSSPDDYNDIGAENRVVPVKTALAVKDGRVQLAPHSLNCIVLD